MNNKRAKPTSKNRVGSSNPSHHRHSSVYYHHNNNNRAPPPPPPAHLIQSLAPLRMGGFVSKDSSSFHPVNLMEATSEPQYREMAIHSTMYQHTHYLSSSSHPHTTNNNNNSHQTSFFNLTVIDDDDHDGDDMGMSHNGSIGSSKNSESEWNSNPNQQDEDTVNCWYSLEPQETFFSDPSQSASESSANVYHNTTTTTTTTTNNNNNIHSNIHTNTTTIATSSPNDLSQPFFHSLTRSLKTESSSSSGSSSYENSKRERDTDHSISSKRIKYSSVNDDYSSLKSEATTPITSDSTIDDNQQFLASMETARDMFRDVVRTLGETRYSMDKMERKILPDHHSVVHMIDQTDQLQPDKVRLFVTNRITEYKMQKQRKLELSMNGFSMDVDMM